MPLNSRILCVFFFFFFQAEDGIRDWSVTGVQTCALPISYRMILDGERRSRKNFKGHSSAMAQVYNHVIMPLANRADRITQIRWGIADYESHYGVAPEGMWLAETAADTDTLELLAQHGIKFTILAPHQCKSI